MRVSVIGYGAMGSGIAKRLHLTGHSVNCYDVFTQRIAEFRSFKASHPNGSIDQDEHSQNMDESLTGVTRLSEVIVICVLDEKQCESVMESLLPGINAISTDATGYMDNADDTGSEIVSLLVTSTLTPEYIAALPDRVRCVQASHRYASIQYRVVDAPISGGSIRSELGSLIVMAAAPPEDIDRVRPVLQSMSNYIPLGESKAPGAYYICGNKCGDGMMVKICHQLIAGANLASAAEGYALAKACGVFSDAFVEICNLGAASSFMLQNRGSRIQQTLSNEIPCCMSSVGVWKKDLGIVRSLAKKHGLTGRMYEAALQGYVTCGECFGFDKDDSYFAKLLQADANLSAAAGVAMAVEVGDEPRHRVMLDNEHVRAIDVRICEGDETLIHTHAVDSLYFFLVPASNDNPLGDGPFSLKVLNTIYDTENNSVTADESFMEYGECRFGNHCSKTLTHKIKCLKSTTGLGAHCIDIEVKSKCPNVLGECEASSLVIDDDVVKLVKDKEKATVYLVTIRPSCTWTFSTYSFFYLLLAMKGGNCVVEKGSLSWAKSFCVGECEWHTAGEAPWCVKNESASDVAFYIIQWK